MKEFAYSRPDSVSAAVAAGREPGSRFLAGGTNLIDLMKLGVTAPARLVDVTALGLGRIQEQPDGLLIGAAVRNSDLAAHPLIRQNYPALAQAVLAGASGQLRNLATVGGNLLQRTRCLYFMDVSKPCNKREPGSGCPARAGEHRNLAILGASPECVATNPSDMSVALTALDAIVHFVDGDGAHQLPIEQFFRLPGADPSRDTELPPGALITAVQLPASPVAAASSYRKVRERASYAFAIGSVAVALQVSDGLVDDVRLALGAVAAAPWRARTAERVLIGAPSTEASFRAAAEAELAAAVPLRDNGYKINLMRNLIVAQLLAATPA